MHDPEQCFLTAQSQGTEKHLRHFTLLGRVAENSHKMKNKPVGQLIPAVLQKQTLNRELEAGCLTRAELSADLSSLDGELQGGLAPNATCCHVLTKAHKVTALAFLLLSQEKGKPSKVGDGKRAGEKGTNGALLVTAQNSSRSHRSQTVNSGTNPNLLKDNRGEETAPKDLLPDPLYPMHFSKRAD